MTALPAPFHGQAEFTESLPPLPTAVRRLLRLVNDEEANTTQFENFIRPDPVLTANILRLANSPEHRGWVEIKTLRQAIARLGMQQVFDHALSISFERLLPSEKLPGYQEDSARFWRHCIAVAMTCEAVGQRISGEMADIAYTAGLLHDVGKLVAVVSLPNGADRTGPIVTSTGEVRGYGPSHAELGGTAADQWELPSPLAAVIRHHHEPSRLPRGPAYAMTRLVHLADVVCFDLGFGSSHEQPKLDPAVERDWDGIATEMELVGRGLQKKIEDFTAILCG